MPAGRNMWPDFRLVSLFFSLIFSAGELVSSAVTLHYSIHNTHGGYLISNPALVAASAVTLLSTACALWLAKTTAWTVLKVEMVWLGICWLLYLGSTIALSHATPGLVFHCGAYFICHSLQAMFAFAWLALLSLTACLFGLLFATWRGKRFYPAIWSSRVESWRYVAGPDALHLPLPPAGSFAPSPAIRHEIKDPFDDAFKA